MHLSTWRRLMIATAAAAAPAALAQTPDTRTPDTPPPAAAAADSSPQLLAEASESPAAAPPAPARPRLLPSTAAAYADFQSDVSRIGAKPLASAKEVESALDTFGGRNPDQLSGGWISYAALIASHNKEFADTVRDIDGHYGRQRMVNGLQNSVSWARTLDGGNAALETALNANSRDVTRISSAAAFVKDQSYKLGKVKWGKGVIKDTAGAANKLKLSARTARPIADAAQKLFAAPDISATLASAAHAPEQGSVWDRISSLTTGAAGTAIATVAPAAPAPAPVAARVTPKFEGTANRIVTLAALHVLEAEATHEDAVRAAIKDKPMTDCIDEAELQLRACVETFGDQPGRTACLATHALGLPDDSKSPSIGKCLKSVSQ